MTATAENIVIEQGATFTKTLTIDPAYNGYALRGVIRRTFRGALVATFTGSTVASGAGSVSLTAAQTAAIPIPGNADPLGRVCQLGVYEIEAVLGAVVVRLREGTAALSQEANA